MPRRPIILDNGKVFDSKQEAQSYFRAILNSGTVKIASDSNYFNDLLSLYQNHPEFYEKSRQKDNILYFSIQDSGQFNTKCFHVVHKDGSQTDWSFITAINGVSKSKFECFVDGARHALESVNHHFRDNKFSEKCKLFIGERGFLPESFPVEWTSKPMNPQYRANLSGSIKEDFIRWYEKL